MGANITIYTTQYCGFCTRAKQFLKDQKKVPFTEVRVDDRADLRKFIAEKSGQRTVPQIFINGKAIGGYSDMAALDNRGALDPLLKEEADPNAPPLPS